MSTDMPSLPRAPYHSDLERPDPAVARHYKDAALRLLFLGAMASQGYSVEQAGKLLKTSERMAARAEQHAAGVTEWRERATVEKAPKPR